MHIENSTETTAQSRHLLERVIPQVVISSAREARLRHRPSPPGEAMTGGYAEPVAEGRAQHGLDRLRTRTALPERAAQAGQSASAHPLVPEPSAGPQAAPYQTRWIGGAIGELCRALDNARADAARLQGLLATAETNLAAARREATDTSRQNDELRNRLRAADAERRQALDAAEQAETMQAVAERARAEAETRATLVSAHMGQAEQRVEEALAQAQQTEIARDAARADAARCQQEALGMGRTVDELRGFAARVTAERDAARAEAERARRQIDEWTAHVLNALVAERDAARAEAERATRQVGR
ncbi:hypothetical protein ACWC9T_24995 [Kitasatospora sp. NPDC001159]